MNPRRVHRLMRHHFPLADSVKLDWILIADVGSIRLKKLQELIDAHIHSSELLVEIHRKLGDFLPKQQALDFIVPYIAKSQIKITDRSFTGFVFVAINGVAAGWSSISKSENDG
jgi:hypothetical protein